MRFWAWTIASVCLVAAASPASATLTISKNATKNVTCSSGVCTATKAKANLNASDLSSMLASGDVRVSSGAKAVDMALNANVSWASTHKLTLDSRRSLTINGTIAVQSTGALTLTTNDGGVDGALTFPKGRATFLDLSSVFVVNGDTYVLVSSVAGLAAAVQNNSSAFIALANNYDAKPDGTYAAAPVQTFFGLFEGAGNMISGLKISAPTASEAGLFTDVIGTVSDFHLKGSVKTKTVSFVGGLAGVLQSGTIINSDFSGSVSGGPGSTIGGLVGNSLGTITNCHTSGKMSGQGSVQSFVDVGGLVGLLEVGSIANSYSTAKITGGKGSQVGGLVGESDAPVSGSYATGTVSADDSGIAGGLIGYNTGSVQNVYANGFVGGGVSSTVGGLIGKNNGQVSDSYSSGPVASGSGNAVGGFIGNDVGPSDLTDTYFDTDTSGQSHGVGNNTAYPGITGLTTEELQAGLPVGLDPAIWAEDSNINGGLPYLSALPPE